MSKVKVDWTKCNGCGTRVDICPVLVFEVQGLPDYPDSKKSVPVRADDCIQYMTCVTSCPTGAIIVEEYCVLSVGNTHFRAHALNYV